MIPMIFLRASIPLSFGIVISIVTISGDPGYAWMFKGALALGKKCESNRPIKKSSCLGPLPHKLTADF